MSPKVSRKSANPRAKAPEPIITRTKSRQQLKNKVKKTEKPQLTKTVIKSPKIKKTVVCSKESPPKAPVKDSDVEIIEQVEYYPNKLKRDVSAKKIMLKPKHNFKVIAATNKRKLATPQKGIKSPSSKHSSLHNLLKSPKRSRVSTRPCNSPELSMQDMVRLMEETRSLSDEDFMEILTCPSPVWWEDPPDGGFDEDSIHTRLPDPPPNKIPKETKKRKITANTKTNIPNKNIKPIKHEPEQPAVIQNKKDDKFIKKKQKLENVLGNIKKKSLQPKNEVKNEQIVKKTTRKLSESEGDISDLSFNEEDVLKNLENMDIPIEQSPSDTTDTLVIKNELGEVEILKETIVTNMIESKNDNVDREILSIEIKPEIREELSISSVFKKDGLLLSPQFKNDVSLEGINSNTNEIPDKIVIVDSCTYSSLGNDKDSNSLLDAGSSSNSGIGNKIPQENSSKCMVNSTNISKIANNIDIVPKKTKDLSEFITVYKIIPDKLKSLNNTENEVKSIEITKLDNVRGKLNDFFKHCKNNVRVKKMDNTIPAITLTDVKDATDNEKENGDKKPDLEDEKNRLKNCDYCIEKTENGTTDFSCEKCEMAPILPCGLCNFLADTKEIYRKHVSTCKDVARISWSHNYVMNQT